MNTIVRGASLYQTQSNPVWDKWAFEARKRFSDPVLIPKSNSAMKEVIRALRASLPFYYLPDMDHGRPQLRLCPLLRCPSRDAPDGI